MSARREDIRYSVDIYSQSISITRAPDSLYQAVKERWLSHGVGQNFNTIFPPHGRTALLSEISQAYRAILKVFAL